MKGNKITEVDSEKGSWIMKMKKRNEGWNDIRSVHKMMVQKFKEVDENAKEYDKQQMIHQMEEMKMYANRCDELLTRFKYEIEEKKKNNAMIEEIDYEKIEKASTMRFTKAMGWDDFSKVNEMIFNLQIAVILAQEPRNEKEIKQLLDSFEKRATELATKKEYMMQKKYEEEIHNIIHQKKDEQDDEMIDVAQNSEGNSLNMIQETKMMLNDKDKGWEDKNILQETISRLNNQVSIEKSEELKKELKQLIESVEGQLTALDIMVAEYGDETKKKDMFENILGTMDENTLNDSAEDSMKYEINSSGYSMSTNSNSGKRVKQDTYIMYPFQSAKKVKMEKEQLNADLVQQNQKQRQEIRVRFQFTIKDETLVGKETGDQVKNILYNMMSRLKQIDNRIELLPWKTSVKMSNLNGNEIKMLSKEQIMHYIDLKSKEQKLIKDRRYYMNGIRLKAIDDADNIVRKWDNLRYKKRKENDKFITTITMKKAEMQQADSAFAVGYMMGTTEKVYTAHLTKQSLRKQEYSRKSRFKI